MPDKKTTKSKKYLLLWPKRQENGKPVKQGDSVSLDHLTPEAIDMLLRKQIYKEVN